MVDVAAGVTVRDVELAGFVDRHVGVYRACGPGSLRTGALAAGRGAGAVRITTPAWVVVALCFFFQAEDGIRDGRVTGVQTCALPISWKRAVSTRVEVSGGEVLGGIGA